MLRGQPSLAVFPISLPSLGSPSSNSSAHMTEEENQIDDSYSSVRRPAIKKKSQELLSSNSIANNSSAGSLASSGLVDWDFRLFQKTLINRTRRPHTKENNDHIEGGKRQSDASSTNSNSNADREAAAIAVLENVIDSYKSRATDNNSMESSSSAAIKVILFLFLNFYVFYLILLYLFLFQCEEKSGCQFWLRDCE